MKRLEDSDDLDVKAALALAAMANSCREVPGEPRCSEIDELRSAGWTLNFVVDDIGFHITGKPPNGRSSE